MFSTIALLNIFVEFMLAGLLISGCYSFAKRYAESPGKPVLYLSFTFIFFSFHVLGVVSYRMMSDIGSPVSVLMTSQRIINSMLAFSALFSWLFFGELANIRQKAFSFILMALTAFLLFLTLSSPLNLVFRFESIEPAIEAAWIIPTRAFWITAWLVLGITYLINAGRSQDLKKRNLDLLSGTSAIVIALGFIGSLLYFIFGYGVFILLSWLITLLSFFGFLIANIISPKDEIALHPLNYLKTRILFKLILLFILMIVLLVEATALATIAISKTALSKSIIETDKEIAMGVADRALYYSNQSGDRGRVTALLQQAVEDISFSQKRVVYIVDGRGALVIHPDRKRAVSRESMSDIIAVKDVVSGKTGGKEFTDKSGERMVGAYAPIPSLGWGVVVSEPINQAYFEIRRVEIDSLIFVIIGLIIAVIVGLFFAKSIEGSINAVISGTEAIRKGNLNYEIVTDSLDEIGQLARQFNLMTAELKESQDHLIASEKLAALGTMAAGMAHEIKNPLVALRTFSQLLPLKWDDQTFRDRFVAIVPPEIEKINKIAENLLKFGRPSKPEFKPINVNIVLEEVLELLENQIKKSNIRVSTKFAKIPLINGDASQLSQAFLNIVLNAVQAMSNGGELIIKSDVGHVIQLGKITKEGFVAAKKQGTAQKEDNVSTIFVEISDTGAGIPEETMKNMFDPFYTTKPNGTGMGLPITLRIIEEHQGSIKVRSRIGKGTTFIIMLPITEVDRSGDRIGPGTAA